MNNQKNKYYYNCNNNIYPKKNNCNIYCSNKKNKLNNKINSCTSPLYEVENFLCNIKQLSKCIKLIKYLK